MIDQHTLKSEQLDSSGQSHHHPIILSHKQ